MVACLACWCREKLFHQVFSGDIDDIQDPKLSLEPSDILLTCTWVCRRLDGSTCSKSSPERTCDFESQSTCHGPRPGPKLACGVRASSLRATEPRARGKTRGRKRKNADVPKKRIYMYVYKCCTLSDSFIYTKIAD